MDVLIHSFILVLMEGGSFVVAVGKPRSGSFRKDTTDFTRLVLENGGGEVQHTLLKVSDECLFLSYR